MWTDDVVVHPWVGEKYENPINFKHKTLVLGESNYTTTEKFNSNLIINCILGNISNLAENKDRNFNQFSTKLRRVIFGMNEEIRPNDFWQDVAFYNFVQFLVGDKARVRPTQEMWQKSVPAFFEIISMLKPSKILVLGKMNWDNLLQNVKHEVVDEFVVNIQIESKLIPAGYINHPATAIRYSTWQPIAQNFLLS